MICSVRDDSGVCGVTVENVECGVTMFRNTSPGGAVTGSPAGQRRAEA